MGSQLWWAYALLVALLICVVLVCCYLCFVMVNKLSLSHLCFVTFLSLYIVLIDVLIYSAAQLGECLINLLTYLLIYWLWRSPGRDENWKGEMSWRIVRGMFWAGKKFPRKIPGNFLCGGLSGGNVPGEIPRRIISGRKYSEETLGDCKSLSTYGSYDLCHPG